jgi:multisubunit Na+/H+ antiporter MnhE subunit
MTAVLRVAVLTWIYLLVLTSLHPGDVLVGIVLSTLLVTVGWRIRPLGPPADQSLWHRLAGVPRLLGGGLVEIARSTWRTALWCVHPGDAEPGMVAMSIPRTTAPSAAAWGVRVNLTPGTIVVELDERRGRMLLHVIDARDPDAVRAEQMDSYQRLQRRVFP